QDGCVVLLARGYELKNRCHARYECASSAELIRKLKRGWKTNRIVSIPRQVENSQPCARLGEIMRITIGCVTGDAQYFLLRESTRLQLGLPVRVLRPV